MSTIKQTDNFSANFGEVLRSSSIFWITQNSNTKTTISLSNYWQFKNNLDVTILVSWRSMRGELLKRHKVEFEFFNVLNLACPFDEFEGSCEIETFCLNNLRIPYSAIMAVYETKDSISMVHSYTRTYSHHEIEEGRTITDGHESCWTIYGGGSNIQSFAVGHNGNCLMQSQNCQLRVRRYDGREISRSFKLKELNPYETFKIFPFQIFEDLDVFLDSKAGNARLDFNLQGAFTRLLCCNQLQDNLQLQVTHSNFDYSQHITDFVESSTSDATAYMVIPPSIENTSFEAIVYPDRSPGNYLAGITTMEPIEDIFSLVIGQNSSVVMFTRSDGKLPSRIVTGLRVYQKGLVAECSLGVIHSRRPGKHFHWMLVSGLYETYVLFTTITEIYGDLPSNLSLCLTLYSDSNKPVQANYGVELLKVDAPIPLGSLFDEYEKCLGKSFGYLTIWSDYPGLMIYSALKKGNSITLEHSF
jgi:hypothetical protein